MVDIKVTLLSLFVINIINEISNKIRTWLHDGNCDLYELSSYVFVERHRHTRKGGGVGIFIKNDVSFQDRNNSYSIHDVFESIFIEIDKHVFNKNSNIVIGVIYRPPNTDINCYNESLNVILEKLKNENKLCFFMDDYNINLLNSEKHYPTSDFVELMHSYSFLSLINRPTRITATSATLIDNILVLLWLTEFIPVNPPSCVYW